MRSSDSKCPGASVEPNHRQSPSVGLQRPLRVLVRPLPSPAGLCSQPRLCLSLHEESRSPADSVGSRGTPLSESCFFLSPHTFPSLPPHSQQVQVLSGTLLCCVTLYLVGPAQSDAVRDLGKWDLDLLVLVNKQDTWPLATETTKSFRQ